MYPTLKDDRRGIVTRRLLIAFLGLFVCMTFLCMYLLCCKYRVLVVVFLGSFSFSFYVSIDHVGFDHVNAIVFTNDHSHYWQRNTIFFCWEEGEAPWRSKKYRAGQRYMQKFRTGVSYAHTHIHSLTHVFALASILICTSIRILTQIRRHVYCPLWFITPTYTPLSCSH